MNMRRSFLNNNEKGYLYDSLSLNKNILKGRELRLYGG